MLPILLFLNLRHHYNCLNRDLWDERINRMLIRKPTEKQEARKLGSDEAGKKRVKNMIEKDLNVYFP
jgi:hypothetical protein